MVLTTGKKYKCSKCGGIKEEHFHENGVMGKRITPLPDGCKHNYKQIASYKQ